MKQMNYPKQLSVKVKSDDYNMIENLSVQFQVRKSVVIKNLVKIGLLQIKNNPSELWA